MPGVPGPLQGQAEKSKKRQPLEPDLDNSRLYKAIYLFREIVSNIQEFFSHNFFSNKDLPPPKKKKLKKNFFLTQFSFFGLIKL